jgi:hypothetical protein
MVLSHVAIGLVSKKYAPRVSLGTLVLAGIFADLVWVALTFLGVEHFRIVPGITLMSPYEMYDTPFSHGLVANIVIAIFFSGIFFRIKKDRRSAIILGLIVLSHWIFDFISHRADMVLITKSGPLVGLELWSSYWGTLVVEIGFFIIGLILYIKATQARRKLAFLPLLLFTFYSAFQFIAGLFVTPPDNVDIGLFFAAIILSLIWCALAYWTDALRVEKTS